MTDQIKHSKTPKVKICSIAWCDKEHAARGYCNTHWKQTRRNGQTSGQYVPYFRSDYSQHHSEPCWNAVCIPLTRGRHAIIDADKFDSIGAHRWAFDRGYATRSNPNRSGSFREAMHHYVLPSNPSFHVDHKNGDGCDNRADNLRYATYAQNQQNRKPNRKYKGVYEIKRKNEVVLWGARIVRNKKVTRLGKFKTEIEAAMAYDIAATKHDGEFARLNLPKENYYE